MSENTVCSESRLFLKLLSMEVKFQKKIKKLFEKRSTLENELYKCHEIILEYIESQSRCSKIDTYIEKCRNYIEQAVEINTELIDMAAKSANPDELIPAQDMWLHKLTQSNDKVLQEAITYKTSFKAVTEPDKIDSSSKVSHHSEKSEKPRSHKTDTRSKVSHRSSRHQQSGSQKSSYTAAPSKTLSEKKRDLMILKKQQEELERQAKVSLRLKEQQSRLELEELAEEHRKKLAEIELKGLELENELSEISEKAEERGLTRISPQLSIDEKDRTRHWVESVDHNQPDAVVVPNQEQHVRSTAPEATYPASTNYLVSSSFTGVNSGHAASSDPGLYYSNHIHGQHHNLSNLVRLQVSVNNPVGLQQVIQPVSNNLPQQTFLSTHPVLGNPNTGSVVPVTSENYFAPPSSAEVPSGVTPFVPASTAVNHVSLSHHTAGSVVAGYQAPAAPSQHMGVPVSSYNFSSDHYNPYSNLWRPAVATPLMSTQQHYVPSTTVFSAVTPIVPTNSFVPYTSGGTVFFAQPENFSHANQPFVPDCHGNSSNYTEPTPGNSPGADVERPLSTRELVNILMHSRKDHLPEWKLTQFDGNPLNWHECFGQFTSTVDSAILSDDEKLTYLKTLVVGKAKSAIAEYSYSGVLYKDALATLQRKFRQPHAVVGAHLDKLSNFPPLKIHNSENVIGFSSAISGLVAVFKSLSFNDDLKSVNLLNQAVSKLPPNLKEAWSMQTVRRQWHRPTLLDFNEWLKEKAEGHERLKTINSKGESEEPVKQNVVTKVLAGNTKVSSKDEKSREKTRFPPCSLCKGQHALWICSVFKEKNATQRAKYVAEQKLCFSCLQGNHTFRKCQKAKKCPKQDCESTHNVLLHGAEKVFPPKEADRSPSTQTNTNTTSANNAACVKPCEGTAKGILPVALVDVSSGSENSNALALCDTGSTHSWVSAALVERLKLVGTPVNVTTDGFNSAKVSKTQRVHLKVSAKPNESEFSFSFVAFVKHNMYIGPDVINVSELQVKYPQLAPLKTTAYNYKEIEIVIGQDFYHAIRPLEHVFGNELDSPCAVRLPIGWVISGPSPDRSSLNSSSFNCVTDDTSLTEQIKTWYELESYGAFKQVDARSAADKRALSILKTETVHDGERYTVPMLWSDNDVSLPNNYYSSLAQLKSLEKKLDKDPLLREKYTETIREDISKGYVITVNPHDPSSRAEREWYLPHHPVLNPNKPGKVRRVLNGASKFHGTSLNRSLLVGPDLLQNLIFVLLRFRQHKYAVSADIEGMFIQVGVLARDQPSLRFLWREDPTSSVVVHQYTRHIFGPRDSPTCANFALQKTASDNQAEYPEAASAVVQKFYMDDYLDSFENTADALSLSKDLVAMLKLGGFNLTKFVSNVPEVTTALNPDNRESNPSVKDICKSPDQSSHVLGLRWDHVKDTLVVSRGVDRPLDKAITQRTVLSFVSSVFDPIGLVAPYTVKARLLLKDIWRISGQKWDDDLPEEIKQQFLDWHSGLPLLGTLTIPRSYFTEPFDRCELHTFGDSSQDVFCAVSFLRARLAKSQKTELAFVFGKARVAPMKMLSIPKLELQAALLATRLKEKILKALTFKVSNVFMWTDSTTVLQWLNSCNKLPVFVGNRTGEILESTTIDQWNHVLSGDNPADTGTRGISSEALKDSSWVRGPSILRTCDWPFKPNTDVIKKIQLKGPLCDIDTCLETASTFVVDASSEKAPSIRLFKSWDKFSSIVKYKRVLAFMLRVLPSHKHFRTKTLEITDPSQLDIAEQKLIYLAQSESFPAEVKIIQSDKLITKKSRIAKYSPFIGPAGILRSTGRISRLVDTDFDSKHPIILDGRHRVAHMLIRNMHFQHARQGLDYMRAVVQLKYIVLKLRWLLGNIENTCITCRKRKAKTVVSIMSNLPIERLGYKQPPFSNTGVDYFGPFQVPIRRSTEKRWGFLFTCLTTRAVHIELVPSLDTSSCVMGVERFIARRGTPKTILSDNGTNFVGAQNELLSCVQNWNKVAPAVFVHKSTALSGSLTRPVPLITVAPGSG